MTPTVHQFVHGLEKTSIAKVDRMVRILEYYGHRIGEPYSKWIQKDLYELRIKGRQEVRIFYTVQRGRAILFHGFVKKTRRMPRRELFKAIAILHSGGLIRYII